MNERIREDFPIEWEDDHFVTRREFFKFLTLASGGIAVGTTALAAYSQLPKKERAFEPALICKVDDLAPGTSKAFSYPRKTDICLLVCRQDGSHVAYSRRCTHLSCPVDYKVKDGKEMLFCPCHNGAFSVEDGSVLQGPPPHALPRIRLEQRGGELWAVGAYLEDEV
ncbi:MAG TPA: Rieske (2Fe-2S) protein [Fimbriimonadaceae bacterium]|nr:Rieske (2Fe-2S) protein [Fimbriimonadaceae bacterium]